MALSALARTALSDERGVRPGAATYSHGYRTYKYENDPSTIRYKQFADEARAQGITDPAAIDRYAVTRNREWGTAHGIDANQNWLERHPWAGPLSILGAGYGAAGLAAGGAAGAGGAAAGAGEGAAAGGTAAGGVGA